MFDIFQGTGILVHLAAFVYVLGFLVRDQLVLRGLVLFGTLLYIAYYYLHPDVPLWDAIGWSVVLGGVNLWVMWLIIRDRTHFNLSEDERQLFRAFQTLTPGEFRQVLKLAEWRTAGQKVTLTVEDETVERLYFVLDGEITIRKADRSFTVPANVFIGEIAFLLGSKASATVEVSPGTRFVQWPQQAFKHMLSRRPSLKMALDSLFNRDMAAKVARS